MSDENGRVLSRTEPGLSLVHVTQEFQTLHRDKSSDTACVDLCDTLQDCLTLKCQQMENGGMQCIAKCLYVLFY